MTQAEADQIFNTPLGSQLSEIFVTSDNRSFIRWGEADKHRKGQLDRNTLPLHDQKITEWYPSWMLVSSGDVSVPIVPSDSINFVDDLNNGGNGSV